MGDDVSSGGVESVAKWREIMKRMTDEVWEGGGGLKVTCSRRERRSMLWRDGMSLRSTTSLQGGGHARGGSDEDFCGGSAVESKGGGWKKNWMEGVRVGDAHICQEGLEEFCVEFEGSCN